MIEKRLCLGWLFVLLLLCLGSSVSWAQDTHYQDYIMGQRAAGMGGAFTGLANDPSAGYYNPAGFATGEGIQVGIGLTLYGFEFRRVQGGLFRPEGQVDLERLEFIVFPSASGVAARFGPRDETGLPVWGAGFSIFMPNRNQIRFRSSFDEFGGTSRRQATYVLHRDDQTFMAGPSLARRIGPVTIGVAAFYVHRAFGWVYTDSDSKLSCQSSNLQTCVVDSVNSATSNLEGFVGQLNFRLGLLFKFSDAWQLGLAASFSSIRLWGEGSYFLQRYSVPRDVKKTPVNEFIRLPGGLQINSPLPWEARAGLVFRPNSRLVLSLDVIFYSPLEYPLLSDPNNANSKLSELSDLFQYPLLIRRNLLFNFNFGGEYMITPRVPFRWGVFTNLSSAPNVPEKTNVPHLPQVHMFGATTSIGLRMWRISFDLGVAVAYGVGSGQRFIPGNAPLFESVPFSQLNVHIYLAGATEMLGRSLQELWERVQNVTQNIIRGNTSGKKPKTRKRRKRKRPRTQRTPSRRGKP